MGSSFVFWGFKSSREILEKSLGTLERDVMTICWQRDEISVRDVCALLASSVAYTTVMTTMDRLFKKGLLERRKSGEPWHVTFRVVAYDWNAASSRAASKGREDWARWVKTGYTGG